MPYIQALNLVTDLNTAHTFDTFCRVADQWEIFIPWLTFQTLTKWNLKDVKIVGNFLERAITASDTGCTFAVML